jgi:hypothetical protein
METTKKWYLSKTIWGVIVAAAGFLFQKFGIDVAVPANIDFETGKSYVDAVVASKGSWESLVAVGMQVIGFALAFYGRVKADTKIG